MKWLWLLLLLIPVNISSQSVADFPRVNSVSSVTVVESFLYFNLEPVIPQQEFRDWWGEMETCTEIAKPYEDIRWFVADIIFDIETQRTAWGIYYALPSEIILTRNQTLERIERTVKHEILHHLIQNTDHEEKTFVRCLAEPPDHQ